MRGDFGASEAQARKRATHAMREGQVPSADAKPTDVHAAAEGAKGGPGGVAATLSEIEQSKSAREAKCARRAAPPPPGAARGRVPGTGAGASANWDLTRSWRAPLGPGRRSGKSLSLIVQPGAGAGDTSTQMVAATASGGVRGAAGAPCRLRRSLAGAGRPPRFPRPHRAAQAQARAHAGVARAVEAVARGVRPPGLGAGHRVRLFQRVVRHRRRRPHDQGPSGALRGGWGASATSHAFADLGRGLKPPQADADRSHPRRARAGRQQPPPVPLQLRGG